MSGGAPLFAVWHLLIATHGSQPTAPLHARFNRRTKAPLIKAIPIGWQTSWWVFILLYLYSNIRPPAAAASRRTSPASLLAVKWIVTISPSTATSGAAPAAGSALSGFEGRALCFVFTVKACLPTTLQHCKHAEPDCACMQRLPKSKQGTLMCFTPRGRAAASKGYCNDCDDIQGPNACMQGQRRTWRGAAALLAAGAARVVQRGTRCCRCTRCRRCWPAAGGAATAAADRPADLRHNATAACTRAARRRPRGRCAGLGARGRREMTLSHLHFGVL